MLFLALAVSISYGKDSKYYKSEDYIWFVSFENGDSVLVRGKKIDKIKNDIKKMISALNKSEKNPESFRTPENEEQDDPPKLKLKNIAGNTVSVEVINGEYLTQRMGTSGADEFLAEATFTLTEHDNIKSVNFIFYGGDHAQPGLYSRKDFIRNYKIRK